MSDRLPRSGRASREYFSAPLNTDLGKDGKRTKRILHHSRNDDEKKASVGSLTIMTRPTVILAKPKAPDGLAPETTRKNDDKARGTDEKKTSQFNNHANAYASPSNAKPVVSILSSLSSDKQQPPRSSTTTPSVFDTNPQMKAAIRLIGDNLDFTDYVQEYLSETNSNFCVIGAIGPQGTGKSTLLSMLSGNDHQDMYRQYAFRPASREAVESCRFQTSKISIFVTKNRLILLDCQAMFSASLLDELLQSGRRGPLSKLSEFYDGNSESQVEIESIQLISFLMQVCHTILLCIDWFIDIDVIRHLRTSEMLRSTPLSFTSSSDFTRFKPNRTVNLVVVHQKAKSEDFYPEVLNRRSKLLKELFLDSKLNLNGSVSLCGMKKFGITYQYSNINYLPLAELKPRPKSDVQPSSGKETFEFHDPLVDYEAVIRELRIKLPSLDRDRFLVGDQPLSEKQWLVY
uniref:Protein SMG9 n=1 Tax=Syphacia muris TaxID=451379 RepID=A0A0N5ALP9_9BILA